MINNEMNLKILEAQHKISVILKELEKNACCDVESININKIDITQVSDEHKRTIMSVEIVVYNINDKL